MTNIFKRFWPVVLLALIITGNAQAYNVVKNNAMYVANPSKSVAVSLGTLYVGEPDTDPTVVANQKTIYVKEEDGTVTAVSQPLTLGAGGVPLYNGDPVTVLTDGDYSLMILDSLGSQIYYIPSDQGAGIISVNTIADLRLSTGVPGASAQLLGYYESGDGGGGPIRVWDASSTCTDDGGACIKPTAIAGGSPGRWIWEYSGPVNVKQYGAKADDTTARAANRAAIQAAINYAKTQNETVIIDSLFHVNGKTVSTYDAALFYCLKIDSSNTSMTGGGHIKYDRDGTTDFVTILMVGDDTNTTGTYEEDFSYTENNKVHGVTFSTTDSVTQFSNVIAYVRAVTFRFAKNPEFYGCRLKGLFREGVQAKSFVVGGSIHHNYAKYCLGASAFNLNGAGVKKMNVHHNEAEFSFECVEDGGLDNIISENTSRYNIFGFRYSGSTTLRTGVLFSGNEALFTGNQPFILRPDSMEGIRLIHNKSLVSGYGAFRLYPGNAAIGSWGDVYNDIQLIGNTFQDANLVGLSSDSGSGISVYGDKITAIGNEEIAATQSYHHVNIGTGTNLDEIFPLDVITSSGGGTGVVIGIVSVAGSDGAQTSDVLMMRKTGDFLVGNTIAITGKGTILGTLTTSADNTDVPPVGMELLESGGDVCDVPYLLGNRFASSTIGIAKGGATITGEYGLGVLYGGTSGYVEMGNPMRFKTTGAATHDSSSMNHLYRSITTSPIPITPSSTARGGIVKVWGESGTDRFFDLVIFGASGATPEYSVISSFTVKGSPAARTYDVDTSERLTLTMASGTYDIETSDEIGLSGAN